MAEIFRIHISKARMGNPGRDPNNYDIDTLCRLRYIDSKSNKKYSYTGAEIEQAIIDAMYNAYYEGREYNTDDILNAMKNIVPITYTMKESLQKLKEYSGQRLIPASKPEDMPEFIEKDKVDL